MHRPHSNLRIQAGRFGVTTLIGVSWLPILSAMAGPAAVLAVYARQSRKDPAAITRAIIKVQPRKTAYIERRPRRRYHILVVTAVLSLPFVQWFAFIEYMTFLAFLLPLACVAGVV